MPYIKQEDRRHFDEYIDALSANISCPGDLNYVISRLCSEAMQNDKRNYQHYNSVIGVLESAKLEFYRRLVAFYEDGKIRDNGDVF